MTSIPLLAAVMLFAPAGALPRGSMDPAAAAPPIENGTPAMAATKPAGSAGTVQQGNSTASTTGVTNVTPRPPVHRRGRKAMRH